MLGEGGVLVHLHALLCMCMYVFPMHVHVCLYYACACTSLLCMCMYVFTMHVHVCHKHQCKRAMLHTFMYSGSNEMIHPVQASWHRKQHGHQHLQQSAVAKGVYA